METENKLLDIEYLETRIKELKEIKSGAFAYKIEKSNRENSNSVYIRFYQVRINKGEKHFFGAKSLRISDHRTKEKNYHTNFYIDPNAILTKSKKERFIATLRNCLKFSRKSQLKYNLNNLSIN